jgi:hypothetical protein
MTKEEAFQEKVTLIQSEAHLFISDTCKSNYANYQDAMNVFLIAKIAALELHIERLERLIKKTL